MANEFVVKNGVITPNVQVSGSTSGTTTLNSASTASGTLTLPSATDTLVGRATTDTLTNKSLSDNTTFFIGESDGTKKLKFQLSDITTDTTRTLIAPDASGTIALTSDKLSTFAATTSAELAGIISDETGSGSLVFATSPTLVTPDLGVASATSITTGRVIVSVNDNANAALRVTQAGTGDALLVEDSGNPDSTPFVIDSAGRVIVGGTTNVSSYGVQINNSNPIDMVRWDAVSTGPTSRFAKSRSGVVGTYSAVASGDTLGTLSWSGDDGTSFVQAASILTAVDGTPGTNDMPGRLVFNTTADGVSTPTERMRITSDGRVAIGSSGNAGTTLALGKSITGSTTAVGTILNGTIQSDVTGAFHGYRSSPATQATAFTISELNHFSVFPQTYGAGSTVTNQYGFTVASTLTGATNNYGFYSNIASGTGRWNFYANGTAANYFGGSTTISINNPTDAALRVTQAGGGKALHITQTGAGDALLVEDSGNPDSTPFVIDSSGRVIKGDTFARSYYLPAFANNYTSGTQIVGGDYAAAWMSLAQWSTSTTTSGGAFLSLNKSNGVEGTHTIVTSGQRVGGMGFGGSDGVKFLGVADIYGEVDGTPGVNDMPGRLVFATTTGGVNTTEKMRLNSAGALGIGTASLTGCNLNIGKNITGATTSFGVRSGGVVQSDVTGSAQYFFATPSTAASSFTIGELYAYRAGGGTIGAGSTVATQIGFGVDSSLVGATNNYGFYSNIASGTGCWNFYADGTANNYFGGNTSVRGSVRVESAATQDAIVLSGRAGGISSYAVTVTPTTLSASRTITFPDADINFSTGLGVPQGGTGTTTLAANNVILGNGTSTVQFVAPGASGNVLTSNGTTWTSAAPAAGSTSVIIAQDKTLTVNNTLTFTGTDASSVAFGTGGTVLYNDGALGTPSSGTLTNCTGLPVSSITASTSTALGVGAIELGHASDTTLSRSSAGVLAVDDVVVPTISSTNTLTNKRINPRSVAAGATSGNLTVNDDTTDLYKAEGLTGAITFLKPSGTPVDGQKLMIRIKDNGIARAITWTTSSGAFRALGATFPTTTVLSKVTYVACIYNGTDSFWDVIATVTQA